MKPSLLFYSIIKDIINKQIFEKSYIISNIYSLILFHNA
jgi:hypothetical protein